MDANQANWIKTLRLLTDDENDILFAKMMYAGEFSGMTDISDELCEIGSDLTDAHMTPEIPVIPITEVQSNLQDYISGKRYHIVHSDRSVYLTGKWATTHDMRNSWIFSTNSLDKAHITAAWHYCHETDKLAAKGIDKPILIIDSHTGTYVDISDEAVYNAHNAAKIVIAAEEAFYAECGITLS